MIESASIVRNLSKIHTFRTIASILPRFPTNLIRSVYCFQSNMVFQKRVFTNYTIHWFRVEYIISSQIDTFISFTRKIVSSLFDVFSWYIEYYKYFYCALLQVGRPERSPTFFIKKNPNCIYLYNKRVTALNFGWGWNRAKEYCVTMINSNKRFYHQEQKKHSKRALCDKMFYHRLSLVCNFTCRCRR